MNRPVCIIFTLFIFFENALAMNGNSRGQYGAGITHGLSGQREKNIALVSPAPVLLSPPTNDTLGINDTALVWSSVPGADKYRVQIAIDGTYFTIVMVDTTI